MVADNHLRQFIVWEWIKELRLCKTNLRQTSAEFVSTKRYCCPGTVQIPDAVEWLPHVVFGTAGEVFEAKLILNSDEQRPTLLEKRTGLTEACSDGILPRHE